MLKEGRPGRSFSYGLLVNESFECNIKIQPANPIEGDRVPELEELEEDSVFLKSASFVSFTDKNFKCLTEIKILSVRMSRYKKCKMFYTEQELV